MTYAGFLSDSDRLYLQKYINQRNTCGISVRKANALLALDKGHVESLVVDVLEIGQSTLYKIIQLYKERGVKSIDLNEYSKRDGYLDDKQKQIVINSIRKTSVATINEAIERIKKLTNVVYSKSGCIKLLHSLGFDYKKPKQIPSQASPQKQEDFINKYQELQKQLKEDEIIYFADAVHPEHQVRPAYGWFHKEDKPAVSANSGRKRINIHGAICLQTFDTPFVDVVTVDANSTIALFRKIEERNKDKKRIYIILDNARYHHASMVKEYLKQNNSKIQLIFLPAYAPNLNSIERLWGLLHKYVTHNRFYAEFFDFHKAILTFLRETVPKRWKDFRNTVTDNFRIMTNDGYNLIA